VTEIAAAYPKSLQNYLGGAGESALQQAYEIGRSALNAGIGLVAIADIHMLVCGRCWRTTRPTTSASAS